LHGKSLSKIYSAKKDTALILDIPALSFISCVQGLVKPDIVFFGEALPDRFWLHEIDASLADFLIVIGTSLEVTLY